MSNKSNGILKEINNMLWIMHFYSSKEFSINSFAIKKTWVLRAFSKETHFITIAKMAKLLILSVLLILAFVDFASADCYEDVRSSQF